MIATNARVVVVAYGESGHRIGEFHHNARISDAMVDRIRELHEDFGWGYVAIAGELHLSLTAVRKICTYERRAETPVKWKRIKLDSKGKKISRHILDPEPRLCTPLSEMKTLGAARYSSVRTIVAQRWDGFDV